VALVEDVWHCAGTDDAGSDPMAPRAGDADAGAISGAATSIDAPVPEPRLVAAG
jgi:hypothetical protein